MRQSASDDSSAAAGHEASHRNSHGDSANLRPPMTSTASGALPALPRVGVGVDVHAFDESRPLWLAGLMWPDAPGLAGDSDGDVAAHASCDALLSAAGLGDLGAMFGTGEARWADASGTALLSEVAAAVRSAGFVIGNVAVQVIGNRPRISSRRAEAEQALSRACSAVVSVTATTTDGLGFTGGGLGLAAVANALVVPIP